jgi:hypothetical protein
MISLTTIKNWFTTGKKPTQAQFWATWDSFWHKDDMIPIAKVDGIQNVYDAINSHINSPTAHAQILNQARFIPNGKFMIYKSYLNTNPANTLVLEPNDVASGFIPDTQIFIPFGKYLGGVITDVENSWNTSPMDFS